MKHLSLITLTATLSVFSSSSVAADSYRWLHVTIDTPWAIFIFLLPMVLIPAILMAILYWKFAGRPIETPEKNKKMDDDAHERSKAATAVEEDR